MIEMKSEPLQDRSRRIEKISSDISEVLESYGYSLLNLPIYEQYDLLKDTAYDFSDESIIRFIDRNTGKTLVLRPDFTPQVCRAVVGYMGEYPLPLRLSYTGEVFRSVDKDRGHKSEKFQIGWELFGGDAISGDIEMILLSDKTLKKISLTGYKFIIGDSAFLARALELAGEDAPFIRKCVTNKRTYEINNFLKQSALCNDIKSLLATLALSFGSFLSVINELKRLSKFDKILSDRITYLSDLCDKLISLGFDKEKLMFDASEAKGLDYYTGVNYEIVHASSGFSLGGGGRYDNLMKKFGKELSACGMALNIDEIMRFNIAHDGGKSFDWLVTGSNNLAKAESLRNNGESVLFAADESNIDKFTKTYKFKNVFNGGNK